MDAVPILMQKKIKRDSSGCDGILLLAETATCQIMYSKVHNSYDSLAVFLQLL